MALSRLLRKRKPSVQFATHSDIADILNEAKADAIVAEILAREGK